MKSCMFINSLLYQTIQCVAQESNKAKQKKTMEGLGVSLSCLSTSAIDLRSFTLSGARKLDLG